MQKVTDTQIDRCDLEPVNFIGAIQPFGALLAFDQKGALNFSSENWQSVFGALPNIAALNVPAAGRITANGDGWRGSAFRREDLIVLEAEKEESRFDARMESAALDRLQNSSSLEDLFQNCAASVAEITHMDRVMIYKFHADLHGEVVAESVKPGTKSFLGLHYPASDIPAPARAMFLKSWVRIIPNVKYQPVPIRSADGTDKTFDLGGSILRAVSPIHLEYLQNMGVAASCTISLVQEGKLWGLIACHSPVPRMIPEEARSACEAIGRLTSAYIAVKQEQDKLKIRDSYQKVHKSLVEKMQGDKDIAAALTNFSPNLVDLISAEGSSAALYLSGAWLSVGKVPSEKELEGVVDWLENEHHRKPLFVTDRLPSLYPPAAQFKDSACGLLALHIPKTSRNYIFWFRPELAQTVTWAGKPEKVEDAFGRLHPRASFALWEEEVTGFSTPWTDLELFAAMELRNAIMGEDLQVQFRKEQVARAEAERAMAAREELMAVLSHDLKNPLGSIKISTALLSRFLQAGSAEKLPPIVDRISRAASNMNALIDDILSITKLEAGYLEPELEKHNLCALLTEVTEMLNPIAAEKQIALTLKVHQKECTAEVDRGAMMQVFSNLVGNAIKFTPNGGTIDIALEACGPENIVISVKDSGPGIEPSHLLDIFDRFWQAKQTRKLGTGLGLAIAKGIVQAHGGTVQAISDGKNGTTFMVTIPIAH